MIIIGWFGYQNARTKKDLIEEISSYYKNDGIFLETCDRGNHFWILFKDKEFTSCVCNLVDKDHNEFLVKEISCESGPLYSDIPKSWINKITPYDKRKEMFPKSNHEIFNDWISKVNQKNKGKEMEYY